MTNNGSTSRKKAVAYLKASAARAADDYDAPSTMDRQREAIKAEADKLGADIEAEFVTTRCHGGPVTEYPEFKGMLATIRERDIDYVIVYRHDMYHHHERTAEMMMALRETGVHIHSATERIIDFAVRDIMTMFAYFDTITRREAQLRRKPKNRNTA